MIGTQYVGNTRGSPRWLGDFGSRDHLLPWPGKLDASQFTNKMGVLVKLNGAASANATSITVDAVTPASPAVTGVVIAVGNIVIPVGTVLDFGLTRFARVTANVVLGATSISVAALPTAIPDRTEARYAKMPVLYVPSGTFVGRTFAERDASTAFGPADPADDEIFPIAFDVLDASTDNDIVLVRPGAVIKENYLPDWTTISATGNEVQTIAIAGTLSAGSFVIRLGNKSTGPIAYNANTAAIQSALDAAFGASQIVAGGTAITASTLTFSGSNYTNSPIDPVEVDISGVTGATGATVTETTPGSGTLLKVIRSRFQCIKGVD